ncbi:MAG: hypothetical protein WCG28_03970, partial [bacterium]
YMMSGSCVMVVGSEEVLPGTPKQPERRAGEAAAATASTAPAPFIKSLRVTFLSSILFLVLPGVYLITGVGGIPGLDPGSISI